MAGALLTAAGLPELITYNLEDYQAVSLSLASDAPRCAALRETLGVVREHGALFDTPLFVRDLEARFLGLVGGLPTPQSAVIDP